MNLKSIIVSERGQTQNVTLCMTPFLTFFKGQNCSEGEEISGASGEGLVVGEDFKGIAHGFFAGDGNVLCLVMVIITINIGIKIQN